MTATLPGELRSDPLTGIHIIDCDAHFTEPPDLWISRTPTALRDRMPVQKTVDGITAWYIDDQPWASTGGNTIHSGHGKVRGSHVVQPFDLVDHSAYEVKARLALMDDAGIWAQVVYPNGIGFASNHIFAIEDDRLRTAILQTYNDFLVDIQEESNGRLLPQALLPIWDMDLTVREMERLVAKGIRGFTLSDKPELLGLPELPEPYFDPMWAAFNETGVAANFHIGAGARREDFEALRNQARTGQVDDSSLKPTTAVANPVWRSFSKQRRLAIGAAQMYMSNVRIIINMCMSNLFDRYPNLKIVSAESGIGWVPFMLEALEFQYDEMITEPEEVALTARRPAEYFRDHIYVMFWFEKVAPEKLIEDVGVNNVLVETDIPHPTCLYPGPREHFARVTAHLDPAITKRILQDNAVELYNVALPSA